MGFVLLIKGADVFVDGASNVAYNYKIPTIIVGLTIVAFGTSAPEAAVSITASFAGSNAISLGNVVGSNIFNILGVIGVSALLGSLTVDKVLIKRDFPFLIISTIGLLLIALLFGEISQIVGIIFLIIIIAYVYYLVKKAREDKGVMSEEVEAKLTIPKAVLYIIIGMLGIIIGSDLVVDSASFIARIFGLSDVLIGLTIVALGTSLPELATSVTALKKGNNSIVIGNVLGSCIFNVLFILGISSAIMPMPIAPEMIFDIFLMTIVTIVGAWFTYTRNEVDKKEGLILLILFIIYMIFVILRN
ncbi:cation:H+ antiporter [Methanobrevibacter olleyae]|uniref:Cation:H+ antiporter n=1 Tax=Methanobrevibacter olleyae TaxID=294671 RepID=A0A126R0R6_METOL|nr:K+-dependent Na+/Ca+ exchanger [Methanobrevibacter olleyae]SFL16318.1 cation:H+ antiporter [Methanobrevibacter olleyae]